MLQEIIPHYENSNPDPLSTFFLCAFCIMFLAYSMHIMYVCNVYCKVLASYSQYAISKKIIK